MELSSFGFEVQNHKIGTEKFFQFKNGCKPVSALLQYIFKEIRELTEFEEEEIRHFLDVGFSENESIEFDEFTITVESYYDEDQPVQF